MYSLHVCKRGEKGREDKEERRLRKREKNDT
jgi:hypothetical protein